MAEEKQGSQRKEHIMKVARGLIWERGYDKTSMRDIAHACAFEPSNTYNYFRSKEQLLYELLREETGEIVSLVKHLEDDDSSTPNEQLRFMINNHLDLTLGARKSAGLMFDTDLKNLSVANRRKIISLRDDYERVLRKVIRRGIDQGYFIETDEKLTSIMIISMIVRSRVWYSQKGEKSRDEIADFIFKFVINSLLPNVNQIKATTKRS